MSHPSPPEGPGGAGPYGQQPQHGGWQQGHLPGQGTVPPPRPPGTPGAPGMPPMGVPGAPPFRKKSTGRTCLTVFMSVVGGLALLVGSGMSVNTFLNANLDITNHDEYGPVMWRNEPAEKVFPKTLGGKENPQDSPTRAKNAQWHRMGISQDTDCGKAVGGSTGAKLREMGCKSALRATYVDPTGNTVATVALAVMPKAYSVREEMTLFFDGLHEEDQSRLDVRALAVKDTSAARWSDAYRSGSGGMMATTTDLPYALVASAGAVDGRKAGNLPGQWGRGNLDTKTDRAPWHAAADSLTKYLSMHLTDLLLKGES